MNTFKKTLGAETNMWTIQWKLSCSGVTLYPNWTDKSANKLHSRVGRVFGGEKKGRSSAEYDIQEHWGITRLGAGADRPSQPCVTEQKTKAPEGQRCWWGERSRGDAVSSRLLQWGSHDGLSRAPGEERSHTWHSCFCGSWARCRSFLLFFWNVPPWHARLVQRSAWQLLCKSLSGVFEALEK